MAEKRGLLELLGLRKQSATTPVPRSEPGPEPTHLALTASGENPIHALLDELKLPWRAPRRAVEQELGIVQDPCYRQDVVRFDHAVQLADSLTPWTARVFERFAPELPITDIDGIVWATPDTHANLQRAHDELARYLGPAAIGRQYNTLVCTWRCGAAAVGLIAWPPAWQSPGLQNGAHAREPRLITACHVRLQSGFRLPPSATEQAWLDSFITHASNVPILSLPIERILESSAGETQLEYVREPTPALLRKVAGQVGYAADRQALIFCTDQLFVIALDLILAFEIDRLLPAKGGGGSYLHVRCRTACPGIADKRVSITSHGDPDGLNGLAHELGSVFGKPVELAPYDHDV
jgi:hypothetical protein